MTQGSSPRPLLPPKRKRIDFEKELVDRFNVPLGLIPVLPANATRRHQLERTASLKRMYESRVAREQQAEAEAQRLANPPVRRKYIPSGTDLWLKQSRKAQAAYDAWAVSLGGKTVGVRLPDEVMILQSYDLYSRRCEAEGRQPLPPE